MENHNLNISNNNMNSFLGNPIYNNKLSKKYIKFVNKNPNANIPKILLDSRYKKKQVLKKKYVNLGFEIKQNKIKKIVDITYNKDFESNNYTANISVPSFLSNIGGVKVFNYIKILVNIALKKEKKNSIVFLSLNGNKYTINGIEDPNFRMPIGSKKDNIKIKDIAKIFLDYYNDWKENNNIGSSLTDVEITKISLDIININEKGGSNHYTTIKLDNLKIIDYESKGKNNCFFWTIKDWIKEHYNIKRLTSKHCNNIRQKFNIIKDSKISIEECKLICKELFNKTIYVINSVYTEKEYIDIKNYDRTLFLMKEHYYLYKGEYIKQYCNKCKSHFYQKHNSDSCKKMVSFMEKKRLVLPNKKLKPKNPINKNKLVLHYDIESHTDNKNHEHQAYIIGFTHYDFEKEKWIYGTFEGKRCIGEFYNYIRRLPKIKYLNAYNGNRFDHYFLSKICLLKDKKNFSSKILISNGSILKLTIEKFDGKFLETMDLNRFLTGSLESNLKSNNCNVAKGSIDHNISTEWEKTDELRKNQVKDYLKCDVLGLQELYEKFNNSLFNDEKLNLCDFMTGSQKCYDIWRTNYLNNKIVELPTKEEDDFYRQSIYGGRCYPNKKFFKSVEYQKIMKGEINFNDIIDYLIAVDYVSLYPSAMLEKYPIGYHIDTNKYIDGKLGIYKVKFITNKKCLVPPIPSRKDEGGLNWDLTDGEGVYTSIDIERAKRHGYKFEIINGKYWDESYPIYKDYIQHYYKKKQSEKKGTPAYQTAKLNLNALYGKQIQRPIYEQKHEVRTNTDINEILIKNVITDILKVNSNFWIISTKPKEEYDINQKINKPSHEGSFILAYSRELMYKVYEDIGSIYDMEKLFYYGDTDSLHVHQKYTKKLNFKNDLNGVQNDLGDGAKIICGMWVAPKLYMEEFIISREQLEQDLKKEKDINKQNKIKNDINKCINGKYLIKRHYRGAGVPQEQLNKTCYKQMLKGLSCKFKPNFQIKKNCLENKTLRYENGIIKNGETEIFSLYHIKNTEVNEDGEYCLEKVINNEEWNGRKFINLNQSYPYGYE